MHAYEPVEPEKDKTESGFSGKKLAAELSESEQAEHIPEKLQKPIPIELPSVAGWKEVALKENGEPLVAMGAFTGGEYDRIFTSSIYYGEREDSPYDRESLEGSLITTFARQEVAEQVVKAEEMMPPNLHIILLDTYRTLEVQQSLYDQYYESLKTQYPEMSSDELSAETQKYVSLPSTNDERPSPHNTGGSIDLAIYRLPENTERKVSAINEQIAELGNDEAQWEKVYRLEMERINLISNNAELLNFGTAFDHGGPEAAVNYFEVLEQQRELTPDEREARDNRRLLYNVMMEVGLQPYADEWWHYNSPKSQMGAKTAGNDLAEYGAAALSEENLQLEQTKKGHLRGNEVLASITSGKLGRQLGQLGAVGEIARDIGDFRTTNLPEATKIKAPDRKAA